jgi:hypothetical protein
MFWKIPENLRIDIYHHGDDISQSNLSAKIDAITVLLDNILRKEIQMSQELDALTVQVKSTTDAEASAVLLLQGLSAQIAAIKTDPVALQKLSDDLKTGSDNLAAAILANTPAA